jgi:signal transduction histidine kinase
VAVETPKPRLILQQPGEDDEDQEIEVHDSLVAGRGDDADLIVHDVLVSRRHCAFRPEGGWLVVEDLASHNGTWVNGERVTRAVLMPRDVVRIGNTRLKVAPARRPDLEHVPTPHQGTQFEKEVDPDSLDSFQTQAMRALGSRETVGRTLHAPGGVDQLSRHTRNVTALYQAGQIVQRQQDPDEMLRSVLRLLATVLDARLAAIVLLDEESELVVRAAVSGEGQVLRPEEVRISHTVARRVVNQRLGVVTADVHADRSIPRTESIMFQPDGSMMMVPVLAGNRALGLLQLNGVRTGDQLHEDDVDLTSTIAGYAGTALENKEMAVERELQIVELKAAQEQLLDAQSRLVRTQRAAAIGQLAGAMAHDGRNALQAVESLKLLKERYPFDEELQLFVNIAVDGQQMVVDMLDEVLAFVRGTEVEENLIEVELAAVARSMVSLARLDPDVRGRNGERSHELVLTVSGQPVVVADPRRLKQLVLNLIKNAAQAITESPGRVEVHVGNDESGAFLSVRDNGAGVPESVQERIFEPMFTTRQERGVGLGLHICRSIAKRYSGSLTFETEQGVGTTFTLRLPRAIKTEG